MAVSVKVIASEIAELSAEERDLLLRDLIAGLEEDAAESVEKAWIQEIQRRAAEVSSGSVSLIPSEAVFAKARRNLGQ